MIEYPSDYECEGQLSITELMELMKDRDSVVTLTSESGKKHTMKADEFFSWYKSQKEKGFTTSKRCIGGIEAVEYLEQFNNHSETFEAVDFAIYRNEHAKKPKKEEE